MRTTSIPGVAMALLVAFALGIANVRGADPAPRAGAAQWTQAERDKGYAVFEHSTLQILSDTYVPPRDALVKQVSCELARGESESIFVGVHNIQGPPLIDTWAEPTIDMDVKVYYRNMEFHQLVYANVIGRIPVGRTGGFWLTFRAGRDTPAGVHSGKIMIVPANHDREPTELELEVRLRPLELPRARVSFGAYFTQSDDPYVGYRKRFEGDAAWRSAIYANMAEYALTSVDFSQAKDLYDENGQAHPVSGTEHLGKEITRAVRAGLVDAFTPVSVHGDPPQDRDGLAVFVRQIETRRKQQDWPEFLYYVFDEPRYPDLKVRERMKRFRGTPVKTVTSMNMAAAYGHGDVYDVWIVYGGDITREMRAEAKRLGASVWTYSCHIATGEPLKNRFYAGLYTWAHDAGGNWIWAYYRNLHYNRMVWSHNADNVMYPAVGYETRRDGIDDYRYLQLLEDTIIARGDHPAAGEASAWLTALREEVIATNPHKVDVGKPLALDRYDATRARAADYIERLGAAPLTPRAPLPVPGLKDEAALYRGKSIDECIAALSGDDIRERRAAAAALYERGTAAAPATVALARQLGDTDVRIPALKALEMIGPAAEAAAPSVKALLDHPDPFVQLGARLTLGRITPE